jgi:hypothetical protein
MATVVNKDFKIKSGLVVEGTTGKINNFDILTKKQADQDYIINLIGGTATPDNTPDTVVKRDGNGSFSAETVTVEVLNVSGIGTISDNDELLIAASAGEDIKLTADDVRVEAVDDFRATVGGDIVLEAGEGNHVYAGSISAENVVVTEGILDTHIGDGTVDGTAGNTVTDRIATAKSEAGVIAQGYADTAEDNAIAAAAIDATSKADAAEDAAIAAAALDATSKANTAESNANDYTDEALLDYTTTANLDTTIDGYGYLKSADLTGYATETYVSDAVDALVDGAPGLLDTLNEIAAAINDDENYATTITTALAGKQGTLTAGDNISIVSDTISVTGLDSGDISDFATAAQSAGTGYFDPIGSADTAEDNANIYADGVALTAENNAKSYADSLAGNYDAYGSAATAESNANSYTDTAIGNLDTDDIEEGVTNQYYTEERAKTDAAELLTGATLTNITITGNGSGLTITAENGVADSDTDDLTEGTNNLYFTDERAVDALEAVVPNFEAVEIDSVAKQVAATLEAATAGVQTVYTWSSNAYRSAEFLVKIANGTHTEISKVLLTLDTSDNIAITEYGIVGTNGSLATVSAGMAGSDVELLVTTANNTSTVTVVGTLLV